MIESTDKEKRIYREVNQVDKSKKKMNGALDEKDMHAHFVKNLASHGLTGEELKKILSEFRLRWWKKGERGVGEDLQ